MHSVITEEDRSQTDTQQNKYKEEEDTIQRLHILSFSRILYNFLLKQ